MSISNIKISFRYFIFLLCSFLYSQYAYCAKDSAKIKISFTYDSSKVEVRQLNPDEQKKLLENPDYKYDRIGLAPKSLWDRFKEWLWSIVEKLFTTDGGKIGLSIFQYILIIAVIVIIILLVLKNDIRLLFYGKSASVAIDFKEFEEDIHKINFEELISDAITKKDFRKAVRLHFLRLLKELTDNNLIKWQIDKTNNDYSMELVNSKYSNAFKELSLMYEYIWYGDFHLDETNFKSTISKFKDFSV